VAAQLVASRVALSSTELVLYIILLIFKGFLVETAAGTTVILTDSFPVSLAPPGSSLNPRSLSSK
jgi:hypothetical protein